MHLPSVLDLLIWVPIVAGIVVLLGGSDSAQSRTRWLALIGAAVSILPVIPLVAGFDSSLSTMQFVQQSAWLP